MCCCWQAMFKFYKAKDRTKYFWVENWAALLEATNLMKLSGMLFWIRLGHIASWQAPRSF